MKKSLVLGALALMFAGCFAEIPQEGTADGVVDSNGGDSTNETVKPDSQEGTADSGMDTMLDSNGDGSTNDTAGDLCEGVVCTASGACTQSICDSAIGECVTSAIVDGRDCDDSNLCTTNDSCHIGGCAGEKVICEDLGVCYEPSQCSSEEGCSEVWVPEDTFCSADVTQRSASFCREGSCNRRLLSGGLAHTCMLLERTVYCVGSNEFGQLGDGTLGPSLALIEVLDSAVAVASGESHSCAVLEDGGVSCWGLNSVGQLGNGTTDDSLRPVPVTGIGNATTVAVGALHSCALLSTSPTSVQCWGANSVGQLGNELTMGSSVPVAQPAREQSVLSLGVGASFGCVLLDDRSIECWGDNSFGQLGYGGSGLAVAPLPIAGDEQHTVIAVGLVHVCALAEGGDVQCWGANTAGQLGVEPGGLSTSLVPINVSSSLGSMKSVVAGSFHTCGLTLNNRVKCWGLNSSGQLGNETTDVSPVSSAMNVPDLVGVQAVEAGARHSCAIRTDGQAYCWGRNDKGQLGSGFLGDSSTPVELALP